MNKAFVRDPDDLGHTYCPKCGSLGVVVHAETLAAQLKPDALKRLADAASFCPHAKCEVAYFDHFERWTTTADLLRPVYPKDPEAPLCGCFGLTRDDVEQDIREGVVTRVRRLLEQARSPDARCATMAASGQCCVPQVQQYYMRLRSAAAKDA